MSCKCECNCQSEKYVSREELDKLEEIVVDRVLREAPPEFLKLLDKVMSKGLDYHNHTGPGAR
jgi:hypothetical protein